MRWHPTARFAIAVAILGSCLVSGLAVATQATAADEFDAEVESVTVDQSTVAVDERVTITATVENEGDRRGPFAARLEIDDDTVDRKVITVGPDETREVRFGHRFDKPGEYEIEVNGEDGPTVTVEPPPEPEFSVVSATLGASSIEAGESADASAEVENGGDADGTFEAELTVDGTVVDGERVSIDAGGRTTVSFARTFDRAGTYEVGVSGESAGTLTVEEAGEADVSVVDARLETTTVETEESVGVLAELENAGDEAGSIEVRLAVDDDVVRTRTVRVGPGETDEVAFRRTFEAAGSYRITVNDVAAGRVVVEKPADVAVVGGSVGEGSVEVGESVAVVATLENRGDATARHTAVLGVGDAVQDERSVRIAGGESTDVRFEATPKTAGSHDVRVDGVDLGTVTATGARESTPTRDASRDGAAFELSAPTISPENPQIREVVRVTTTVENVGGRAGEVPVRFSVDGDGTMVKRVRLDAGESRHLAFTRSFSEGGTYELEIDDAGSRTVLVGNPGVFGLGEGSTDASDVFVLDATIPADWTRNGSTTRAHLIVENEASKLANRTFEVSVDGRPVARRTVWVAPNTRTEVDLQFEATSGLVTVDGIPAGHLQVGDRHGPDGPADASGHPPDEDSNPVLFVGAVFIVLGTSVLALGWIRSERA